MVGDFGLFSYCPGLQFNQRKGTMVEFGLGDGFRNLLLSEKAKVKDKSSHRLSLVYYFFYFINYSVGRHRKRIRIRFWLRSPEFPISVS